MSDDEIDNLLRFAERAVADEHEIEHLLRRFSGERGPELATLPRGARVFAPGSDFDETVCIMAIPAEDDPVHGIGPEDKHATLLYFGDRSKSTDPARIEGSKALFLDVLKIAAAETAPFTARVKEVEALGDEGAQVWLLDSPDLQRLFAEIPEIDSEIASMYEDADATRYPEYLPHVTIGYTGDDSAGSATGESVTDEDMERAQQVKEIAFDRLSLWWGNEHVDVPLGTAEFDALLEYFGSADQPRAGKGSPGGGRWIKPDDAKRGGGGGDSNSDNKQDTQSKAKRTAALVKGVLEALDDVLDDLTSKQARALVERIKDNAKAFIDGQSRSGGGGKGGGPAKGGKDGGGPAKGGPAKGGGPGKDGGKDEGDGGGGSGPSPGTVEAVVKGLKGLIRQFGRNMKPKDRAKLERAVKDLGS